MNHQHQAEFDHRLGEMVRKTLEDSDVLRTLENSNVQAVVCQIEICPHCKVDILAIHAFCEVMHCPKCNQRFATSAPLYPSPEEITAIDWQMAIDDMTQKFPAVCQKISELTQAIVEERSAN